LRQWRLSEASTDRPQYAAGFEHRPAVTDLTKAEKAEIGVILQLNKEAVLFFESISSFLHLQ
jgi:hypothetical protein